MEILLDTTAQIDRIFMRERKEKIEKIISQNNCGSSTFVLGEFKNNIIKDCLALYNIIQMEEDISGVRKRINETVFNRSFQRMYYIYGDLCDLYDNDYELIKEEMKTYAKRLERRFLYGIDKNLLNRTDCHRAKAQICIDGSKAELKGIGCRKTDDLCHSCEFWSNNCKKVEGLETATNLDPKNKNALTKLVSDQVELKGNICKSMGDCIISLEALETENKMVCTTNVKDFKPICDYIGVNIKKI